MIFSAWLIFQKDLRLRLRDRSVLMFAFVIPFGLTWVFSLVFPDPEAITVDAAVVDLDGSQVSRGFVDGVVAGLVREGLVTQVAADGVEAARRAIEDGEAGAAWVIPPGFGEAVTAGRAAELQVLVGAAEGLQAEIAAGIADGYLAELERARLAVATTTSVVGDSVDEALLSEIVGASIEQGPGVGLAVRTASGEQLDSMTYLSAGMAVFFLFFTVQFGVTGLLEERQQGTLPRLRAAPIPLASVPAGKALGAFMLGVVSMAVLAVGSTLVLGADWGDPFGVAVLVVAGVLAATGLMALVGTFARSAEQASNLQSIVGLVLGMLGGVFFPLGGGWLGRLAYASPHRWFLEGIERLAGEGGWTVVLTPAAVMASFGLVAVLLAAPRMRKAIG